MLPTKVKSGLYQSNTLHLNIKLIRFSFLKNTNCSEHWALFSRTSKMSQSATQNKLPTARGPSTLHYELFIYCLFHDALNVSRHTASNGRKTGEWKTQKDMKGSDSHSTEVIYCQLPGGTEENHRPLQSGCQVYQPRLEHSTSQVQVLSVTATVTCSVTFPLFLN